MFKTLRHYEQMILSSSMYEKHTYKIFLREFLKLFKCLVFNNIYTVSRFLDLLFKALYQERKIIKERILIRLACAPCIVVVLSLFIYIWYVNFS